MKLGKLRGKLKMFLSQPHFHSVKLIVELFLLFLFNLRWLVNYFVNLSDITFDFENTLA